MFEIIQVKGRSKIFQVFFIWPLPIAYLPTPFHSHELNIIQDIVQKDLAYFVFWLFGRLVTRQWVLSSDFTRAVGG